MVGCDASSCRARRPLLPPRRGRRRRRSTFSPKTLYLWTSQPLSRPAVPCMSRPTCGGCCCALAGFGSSNEAVRGGESAAPVEPAEVVEPFPFNPSPLAARRTTVTELPRRQALWRDSGGEWAEGPVWQHGAATLLEARSETELASALEQRPTYRFVLERKSSHISTPDT